MATITAALVKDLREKTGAGMMDCKHALNETAGDIEAADRLAAQEGPCKSRQEERPRRRRGSGRRRGRGRVRRGGRSQLRDRLRRAQRRFSGAGARRRRGGARSRAPTSTSRRSRAPIIPAAGTVADAINNAIATIGENMTLRRAEGLSVAARRDRPLRAQPGRRRPWPHRRAGRARIDRRERTVDRVRPPACDACRGRPARAR